MGETLDLRQVVVWGVAGAALDGASESGDLHVVLPCARGALVALIDGLGHGPEAAHAAHAAAALLAAHSDEPPVALLQTCHQGLRRTRGVAMSLARFDVFDSTMTWTGVGNVDGILMPTALSERTRRQALVTRGGVVGYQLPPLRAVALDVLPNDVLILASDGIRSEFADGLSPRQDPQLMADAIFARYAKPSDDALVLVVRYLGQAL